MRGTLAIALLTAVGCGDDGATPTMDGGVDGGSPDTGMVAVAAAHEPTAPVLTVDGSCPPGWAVVAASDGLPAFCDPFPDGIEECLPHEAHVPGEPGCHAVGRPCAADFPDVPDGASRALYVRRGATGDGSRAAPFGSIARALEVAGAGDAVLIAAGTYAEESLSVLRPVILRGACASSTRIVAPTADPAGSVIDVFAADVIIEDLSVSGPRSGIAVQAGGSATVRGVAFIDVGVGSLVVFGELVAEDVVARIVDRDAAGPVNVGLGAYDGATVVVRRSVFRGHNDQEMQIGGSTATFEDVLLGAQFEGSVLFGGRGLEVASGATVVGRRMVVDASAEFGVLVGDAGSSLTLEDATLAEIEGEDIGSSVGVADGASVNLRRTHLWVPVPIGIIATRGGRVFATDVLITSAGGGDLLGYAVQASAGALIELERASIVDAATGGVAMADDAQVRLTDTTILGTGAGRDYSEDAFVIGIAMLSGMMTVERVRLEDNDLYGVGLGSDATLQGTDLSILGTRTHPDTREGGALFAIEGATMDLERILLEDNQNAGLLTFGEDTRVTLTDLIVRGTLRAGCFDPDCTSFLGGIGLGVYDASTVTVTRFALAHNELFGAQVAYGHDDDGMRFPVGGTLNLSSGVVEGNLVGINVQVEGYEYDRFIDVLFVDNERNYDSTLMPVPSPPAL